MRIALAVIAGDDCFEQGVERMLENVLDQPGRADEAFLSFNGTNGEVFARLIELAGKWPLTIRQFVWMDDFAAARNHSFQMVEDSGKDFDWIAWLDCDDVLHSDLDFKKIAERAVEKRAHGVLLPYYYAYDEEHDQALTVHYKERLFRADLPWRWVRPIHETATGPVATRMLRVSDMGAVVHLRGDGEKRERNRRITARWWRQFKEGAHRDSRALVFMGNEVYAEAEAKAAEGEDVRELAEQAVSLYREYLDGYRDYSDPTVVEDDYTTNLLVGRCLFLAGRPNDAINIYLQGVKLKPTWPGAYISIAETYLAVSDYEKAVEWARLTVTAAREVQSDHAVHDPLDANYKPLMVEGAALMEMRDYGGAKLCFAQAMAFRDDEHTRRRHEEADAAEEEQFNVDDQLDSDVREMRERRWGDKGTNERSICFWTSPSVEEWDAELIDSRGSGGTEFVVTRLAQNLAKRGWRVVIFGTPRREGVDLHGVEFYHSYRWHPDEPFDVFVSVRAPQLLDAEIKADYKVLWLHDVNVGDERFDEYGRDRFSRADAIVCPSHWHANHLDRVYHLSTVADDEEINLYPIPNGFDRDLFLPRGFKRDPFKFVYASSPDRGLKRLLDLWPQIRDRHPKSSLHVFYGWDFIEKIAEAGLPQAPQLLAFRKKIEAQIKRLGGDEGGIHWHGRVNQQTLVEHFRGSETVPAASLSLYPSSFMETGGLVFMQAMTAGVLPVVSDMGNLPDLLGNPSPYVVGGAAPDSEVYGLMFVDRVHEMLALHEDDRAEMVDRLQSRTLQYQWTFITDHWESLFDRALREKAKAAT